MITMTQPFRFEADGYPSERLAASALSILDKTTLLSMATVCEDGTPYINTCFFAYDGSLRVFVLTPPTTTHAKNLAIRPDVSIAVFDSHQVSGAELQGLQLAATGEQAQGEVLEQALNTYSQRFPGLKASAPDVLALLSNFESRLFVLTVHSVKIFDEIAFGKERWISATIVRG